MIWRSRRGWVLRVQDEYVVVNVLGIALETYAPARLVFGERTYFVDHYVEDGQLVARTAVDVRWGKLHEMSVLEEGLVADLTQATRRHLRALQTKSVLIRLALDDLDERNVTPSEPAHVFASDAQPASPQPELTLWSSQRGMVVRVSEQYYVLDHARRLLEVHAPDQFTEAGRTYFVDHYVKNNELVRRTAIDQRWGEWSEKVVLEVDLHEVIASDGPLGFAGSPAKAFEHSFTWTDVRPDEPDLDRRMREAEVELATPHPVPPSAPVPVLSREVKRAMECLRENDDNALCKAMLQALRALSEEGAAYAMTALARASLLYLKESDVPTIDETWEPVQSPLARRIARLVDDLDARNAREAADAMETCAALLGYRDGFPVLRP